MSLNIANLNVAFELPKNLNNIDRVFIENKSYTDQIYQNTGLQTDTAYIERDTLDNKKASNLKIKNYRTTQYTNNSKYLFKADQLYDLQGIHDGKGPGRNINVDDNLTRGHIVPKPNDRLSEQVTYIRNIHFYPKKHQKINHDKFLVSTTLSTLPQTKFAPQFNIYGKGTKHYNRLSDSYYRNIKN